MCGEKHTWASRMPVSELCYVISEAGNSKWWENTEWGPGLGNRNKKKEETLGELEEALWFDGSCGVSGALKKLPFKYYSFGCVSSCGVWAPEQAGSVVVAHGLSCPMACGILVPQPGMEPMSPTLEGKILTTRPPGRSLKKSSWSKDKSS